MYIFVVIAFILIALYIFKIGEFWWAYKHSAFFEPQKEARVKLSLIIAFKNEKENLGLLFSDLEKQKYPNFEVLLLNDHSTDNSLAIAKAHISAIKKGRVLNLPEGRSGKKQAIAYGIEQSTADYIVTTDADCRLTQNWLYTLAAAFEQEDADLLSAPVWMQSKNLFEQAQVIEFASLVASGAASLIRRKPIMCNAANLAFKRSLYYQNRDIYFQNFNSGDDIMLLLRAKEQKKKIFFVKNENAVVYTFAKHTFSGFIRQRQRWASKSKFYSDFAILFMSFLVFSSNLSLIFVLFYSLKGYLLAYISKSIMDILFLRNFYYSFSKKLNLPLFFGIQLLYPFYILVSALGLIKTPKWKD